MHPIVTALALALTVHTAPPVGRAEFQGAMRKLWEDHVTWTRLYIVSAAAGLPDAPHILEMSDVLATGIINQFPRRFS